MTFGSLRDVRSLLPGAASGVHRLRDAGRLIFRVAPQFAFQGRGRLLIDAEFDALAFQHLPLFGRDVGPIGEQQFPIFCKSFLFLRLLRNRRKRGFHLRHALKTVFWLFLRTFKQRGGDSDGNVCGQGRQRFMAVGMRPF